MLPPGHIAAGFLTAKALIALTHPNLDTQHLNYLLWWGMLFGFAPDLDMFAFFIKNKTFLVANREANEKPHRKFFTHAPLYWLVAGLSIYFISSSVFWKNVGLLLWLGSWSHFLLDTVEYGLPWLRPFSQKFYAFKDPEYKIIVPEQSFLKHSWHFVLLYTTRLSFYLEVLIILIAVITVFTNY